MYGAYGHSARVTGCGYDPKWTREKIALAFRTVRSGVVRIDMSAYPDIGLEENAASGIPPVAAERGLCYLSAVPEPRRVEARAELKQWPTVGALRGHAVSTKYSLVDVSTVYVDVGRYHVVPQHIEGPGVVKLSALKDEDRVGGVAAGVAGCVFGAVVAAAAVATTEDGFLRLMAAGIGEVPHFCVVPEYDVELSKSKEGFIVDEGFGFVEGYRVYGQQLLHSNQVCAALYVPTESAFAGGSYRVCGRVVGRHVIAMGHFSGSGNGLLWRLIGSSEFEAEFDLPGTTATFIYLLVGSSVPLKGVPCRKLMKDRGGVCLDGVPVECGADARGSPLSL